MARNLISQQELLAAGWKKRQIEAALDAPDDVGPTGHWLNTSGKPYYDSDRAAVAAFRIGVQRERPAEEQWRQWASDRLPTSLPVLTADFHRLSAACLPGISARFWSLRLSHPVQGRKPGTRESEVGLIEDCLIRLIKAAFSLDVVDAAGLETFLRERSATAAKFLGDGWPEEFVVRPAHRSSYVSKATSKRAIERFICAISLIHAGAIVDTRGRKVDVRDFLIDSPRFRFDRRICADIGQSQYLSTSGA